MSTQLVALPNQDSPVSYSGHGKYLGGLRSESVMPTLAIPTATNKADHKMMLGGPSAANPNADPAIALKHFLDQLREKLMANKDAAPKDVAKIGMDALKAVQQLDPKMAAAAAPMVVKTVLEGTNGASKAQFMAEMVKDGPTTAKLLDSAPAELKSLKDANLSHMDPKDVALLAPLKIEMSGKWPANVDLSNKNLDGVHLNLASAPGLKVLGATGNFKITGDVSGGHQGNDDLTRKNAAMLSGMGAKVDKKFMHTTDHNGQRITTQQAYSAGGMKGIEESMKPAAFRSTPTFGGV